MPSGLPLPSIAGLRRRFGAARGFASVGVVAVVVSSMVVTVFGAGAASRVLNVADGNIWLAANERGEVARVNANSGKVDQRVPLTDAKGHPVKVTQTDGHVLLRDEKTGKVSALNLTDLGIAASIPTPAGKGTRVVMASGGGKDAAYLINEKGGTVQQIDPTKLTPIGGPVCFAGSIVGGSADDSGRVWVAVPGEGTLVALRSAGGNGGAAGGKSCSAAQKPVAAGTPAGAQVVSSSRVTQRGHQLMVAATENGAAVVDATAGQVFSVAGGTADSDAAKNPPDVSAASAAVKPVPAKLGSKGPLVAPERAAEGVVPVTSPSERAVYLVRGASVSKVTVPGTGANLGAAVVFANQVYIADNAAKSVRVFTLTGQAAPPIDIPDANGPIELEVREDHLVINAPNSKHAKVVDSQGRRLDVDKYPNDVPGPTQQGEGQAPAISNQPTPTPGKNGPPPSAIPPDTPPATGGPPATGDPGNGPGTPPPNNNPPNEDPGNGNPNEGPKEQGPPENGPDPTGNPSPADRPPGQVSNVQATAGNASARVSWSAPGDGGGVSQYVITGEGVSRTVASGEHATEITGLKNGTEYRFTVTAKNRRGSGSGTLSNPVTPTGDVPGAPTAVKAQPDPAAGTVAVSWTPPADKGKGGLSGYRASVTGSGTKVDLNKVTGTSLTIPKGQLKYGQAYQVTVTAEGTNGGAGEPSQPASFTPTGPAGAPGDVKQKDKTADSVTFSWTAPAENGGSDLSGYEIKVNGQPGNPPQVAAGTTEYVAKGLKPNQKVRIEVRAKNGTGLSDPGTAEGTTDDPTPKITLTTSDEGYSKVKVTYKVDFQGAEAGSCELLLHDQQRSTKCEDTITSDVDAASSDYTAEVKAKTKTGKSATEKKKASSQTMVVNNLCENETQGGDCALGILDQPPQSDPNKIHSPKTLAKGGSSEALCYGTGYRSQTGQEVPRYASLNQGKGRQSSYWIKVKAGGYIVGAYLDKSDDDFAKLPKCK